MGNGALDSLPDSANMGTRASLLQSDNHPPEVEP